MGPFHRPKEARAHKHIVIVMSSSSHYIQAETSARIDACFGGVVVESGTKFQYYQDRNKRWPFTCSEKGCACFFVRSFCSFSSWDDSKRFCTSVVRALSFSSRVHRCDDVARETKKKDGFRIVFGVVLLSPSSSGKGVAAVQWKKKKKKKKKRRFNGAKEEERF